MNPNICDKRGRCVMSEETDGSIISKCVCKDQTSSVLTCVDDFCSSVIGQNCRIEHTESCVSENFDITCKCKNELYSGKYCERVTNLCETNTCQNGATCVKMSVKNSCCHCNQNFTGKKFNIQNLYSIVSIEGSQCEVYIGPTYEATFITTKTMDSTSTTKISTSPSHDTSETSTDISSSPTKTTCITSTPVLTTSTSTIISSFNMDSTSTTFSSVSTGTSITSAIYSSTTTTTTTTSDTSSTDNEQLTDSLKYNPCDPHPCTKDETCFELDDTLDYTCICSEGETMFGKCRILNDPCGNNPCLNYATCMQNKTEYNCECIDGYEGSRCQFEQDICEKDKCEHGSLCVSFIEKNHTFDSNGSMKFIHTYKCICTQYFYGIHCEIPYYSYVVIKTVSKSLGIASFISIGLLFLYILIMDLLKYVCKIGVKKK
jgi:hypothetical protein